MRKTIVLWVALSVAAPAAAQEADPEVEADRIEEQLRTLRRETWELSADLGESYRRLAGIRMQLFENVDGSRVTITQENGAGPLYRLVEVSYAIDGESVFHRRDESGALGRTPSFEVHDGVLSPGEHTLSIVLRYVGDGGPIVRYLEGYRFTVRSSNALTLSPGHHTRMNVRSYERAIDVPYEHRLAIEYDRVVERWTLRNSEAAD
jgi:hypothetical protein